MEDMMQIQPFAAEREWTAEGIPVLSALASVPQPEPADSRAARRIKRYYQLQCRAYLRYCQTWLFPQAEAEYRAALASSAPLPSWRAELRYTVTYQEGSLWSLYTESRETTGPGPALITRRGDTWDLAAGYPVPLHSFFPGGTPWRKQLLTYAAEEMERRERAGVSRWHEDWRRRLKREFNPQNYYLTEEGLAFFYPMYALGPASEGVTVFIKPFEIIPDLPSAQKSP